MLAGTAPPQLFPPGPPPVDPGIRLLPLSARRQQRRGWAWSAFRHYVPERERHINNGAGPQVVAAERLPFLEGGERR
ncbi:hypothetical protein HX99_04715 [Peptococcaceae bacterium SCADC1_2_3]|jgi:hypothetical protein|nr:hypothetical protein DK28_0201560 [Peptococcaceae bacterium SCADC1_2_3]KFI37001.1 hypothetical protein HX99_04715 [Peptococcaceae bacterium SCADC1_2_3]KFI37298.1 hypothetical protein HY02_08475 [Peptococcaceae bacterium SCADC1_2_3]